MTSDVVARSRIRRGARSMPDHPVAVAVVPLFQPSAAMEAGLRSLAAQVDRMVLVDDGSPADPTSMIDGFALENATVVRTPSNRGIAHALNRGVEIALADLRADLVVTVDQDSVLADDYVARGIDAIRLLMRRGAHFTAVAAGTVDGKLTPGRPMKYLPYRLARETIQSGMIFPAEVLRELGPFDESLFIDCVDTDYILRGVRTGRPTVLVPECAMEHSMGAGIAVRLPFFFRDRDRRLPYHGPVRRYYIARNRTRLMRRFALSSPSWVVRQSYEQAKSAAADFVWGPERKGQLTASVFGVLDGLRERGGRINPQRATRLATPADEANGSATS